MTTNGFGTGALIAALGISVAAGPQAPASASAQRAAAATSSAWRTVPGPAVPAWDSANLTALAMSGPSLGWAAGFTLDNRKKNAPFEPLLAAWNGRAWRRVRLRLGVAGRLDGLAARPAAGAWAVGTASPDPASMQPLILHWNGHRWARVPAAGVPGYAYVRLLGVAVRSAADAWAVGEAQPAASAAVRPVIEHWNGQRWRLMANPEVPPQTALTAVTVAPDGQAWAVGSPFTNSRRGVVLHWTGRSWVTARTPATSTSVLLDGVTAVRNNIWAVGTASGADGSFAPYVLRSDGRRWATAKVPPVAGGQFESVTAVVHGELIAVGEASKGALYGLWNGRRWTAGTSSKIAQLNSAAFDVRHAIWAVGSITTSPQTFRPVVQVNR